VTEGTVCTEQAGDPRLGGPQTSYDQERPGHEERGDQVDSLPDLGVSKRHLTSQRSRDALVTVPGDGDQREAGRGRREHGDEPEKLASRQRGERVVEPQVRDICGHGDTRHQQVQTRQAHDQEVLRAGFELEAVHIHDQQVTHYAEDHEESYEHHGRDVEQSEVVVFLPEVSGCE
ncbi:hypothetical protein EGW08_004506, partial [Elysia chlorotica]